MQNNVDFLFGKRYLDRSDLILSSCAQIIVDGIEGNAHPKPSEYKGENHYVSWAIRNQNSRFLSLTHADQEGSP
jgi:hypothetical protein